MSTTGSENDEPRISPSQPASNDTATPLPSTLPVLELSKSASSSAIILHDNDQEQRQESPVDESRRTSVNSIAVSEITPSQQSECSDPRMKIDSLISGPTLPSPPSLMAYQESNSDYNSSHHTPTSIGSPDQQQLTSAALIIGQLQHHRPPRPSHTQSPSLLSRHMQNPQSNPGMPHNAVRFSPFRRDSDPQNDLHQQHYQLRNQQQHLSINVAYDNRPVSTQHFVQLGRPSKQSTPMQRQQSTAAHSRQAAREDNNEIIADIKARLDHLKAMNAQISEEVYVKALEVFTWLINHPSTSHRVLAEQVNTSNPAASRAFNNARRNHISSLLGSSLISAFRTYNVQYSFKTVSAMAGISKNDLLIVYRDAMAALGQTTESNNLGTTVERIADALQFSPDLIQDCLAISNRMAELFDGRNIKSLAASAVYAVGVRAKIPNLTRKDVGAVSGVSDVTLWSLAKLVKAREHEIFL